MHPAGELFSGKGHPLNEKGQARTIFRRQFVVTTTELTLGDDAKVPIERVEEVRTVKNRVALLYTDEKGDGRPYALQLKNAKEADDFRSKLNQARAVRRLVKKREALRAQGREHELRVVDCVFCRTPIDMTRFDDARQVDCPYCSSIFTPGDDAANRIEASHQFCEECGRFAHVQEYTTWKFLFIFLLVFYYFSHQMSHEKLCPSCARGRARNRFFYCLFLSFIFIPVTLPVNAWAYLKALFATGKVEDPQFARLEVGNRHARKGRHDDAIAVYADVSKALVHAGVLLNLARVLVEKEDLAEAAAVLERAVALCPNRLSAHQLLAVVYETQGDSARAGKAIERVRYLWEVDEKTLALAGATDEGEAGEARETEAAREA